MAMSSETAFSNIKKREMSFIFSKQGKSLLYCSHRQEPTPIKQTCILITPISSAQSHSDGTLTLSQLVDISTNGFPLSYLTNIKGKGRDSWCGKQKEHGH